ncbi:MAG TPA: PorP/SprF family type IX secretion system membrane protein [Ferruginibacter sp.]|nr:PorP/SprF family type IX secretion system membrane protein [Ferruginibacter sp.]HMP21151.1 PorP/SprF family type IX secretion system membrane protein [Ferruginibacter sp.]
MRKRIIHTVILSIICINWCKAQVDPHFSQYYAYPLYLNPGLTGVLEGDYRATVIHRNQWSNFGKAFITTGASADMTTSGKTNIGINLFNQSAGDGGYKFLQGAFSLAYSGLQLDAQGYKRVMLGIQIGFINRRFDPDKLKFGDQWVAGIGYDPSRISGDILTVTSATAFDAAAGIVYLDANPEKRANPYAGFSINHLTRPEDPFIAGIKYRLPYRYTLHGGMKFHVNESLILTPNFIYMQQGNATETMLGAYLQVAASAEVDVMGGLNYRIKDAVSPYAGLRIANLQIGLSYDVNTSALGRQVSNSNSIEMSLTITGRRNQKDFYYLCPPRF